MIFDVETLINCICYMIAGAGVPLIIFEVIEDLKEKRGARGNRYFSNGKWHQK